MVRLLELFWSFFKIGTFTLGGGYAMIPLMEREIVDRHQWLGKEEFMDVLSVSQALPGLFAANVATNVGSRLRGASGAVVAVLGNIAMPVCFILALAIFFSEFRDNHVVESIFMGIRPAVVALIAAPVFKMAQAANVNRYNFWVPVLAALLIWAFGISPVLIIVAAAAGGFLYGRLRKEAQS